MLHLPSGLLPKTKGPLRLPIQANKFATVLSVYAPTLKAETGLKKASYQDLHNLLQQVNSRDKPLILGDFNARVERDFELWKGVLGRHGIGNCDNGRLALEFCSEHQLDITNTLFQQRNRFKATWRHPRSKHWHLLDYVLTRQRDTRDVVHTKVMPSADCHNGLSEFSPEEWNCGSAFKKTTPASLGDNYLPAQRTAARQQKGLKQQLVLRMSWAYSGIMASALFPRPTGIPAE